MEIGIYLGKSSLLLILFFAGYQLFLAKQTLYNTHRHYFIAGILTSFILPLLTITQITYVAPPEITRLPISLAELVIPETSFTQLESLPAAIDWWQIVVYCYISGAVLMFLYMLRQLFQIKKLLQSYKGNRAAGFTHIVVPDQEITPFSFFKNIVYNPQPYSRDELEMILTHEKVHASQWHTLDILFVQLFLALQWFNPFAWLYRKQLIQNLEFIADQETMHQAPSKKAYQLILLKCAAPSLQLGLTNQFYQSLIKKRIVMLNTPTSKKRGILKLGLLLPFLGLFFYSFNVKEEVLFKEVKENSDFAKKGTDSSKDESSNSSKDSLSYIITAQSSDAELQKINNRISKQEGVQLKLVVLKRNVKKEITQFEIQSRFTGQNNFHKNIVYKTEANKLLKPFNLWFKEGEILLRNRGEQVLTKITPNGVVLRDDRYNFGNSKTKSAPLGEDPIHVINRKIYQEDELGGNPITADSVTMLFPEEAIEKYGEQAKDGAFVYKGKATIKKEELLEPVFEKIKEKLDPIRTTENKSNQVQNSPFTYTIAKNTTDTELEKIKKELKEQHNVEFDYSVGRNSNNKITKLQLKWEDASGNSGNTNTSSTNPINTVSFSRSANGAIGTSSIQGQGNAERLLQTKYRLASQEARLKASEKRREEFQERIEERREAMEERRNGLLEKRGERHEARLERRKVLLEKRGERHEARLERRKDLIEKREEQLEKYTDSFRISGSNLSKKKLDLKKLKNNLDIDIQKLQEINSSNQKTGPIKINGEDHYYIDNGDKTLYYNRFGEEVDENGNKIETQDNQGYIKINGEDHYYADVNGKRRYYTRFGEEVDEKGIKIVQSPKKRKLFLTSNSLKTNVSSDSFKILKTYIIKAEDTNENLKGLANTLAREGISVNFSQIERGNGIIQKIQIELKDDFGNSSSATFGGKGKPIPSIFIGYQED